MSSLNLPSFFSLLAFLINFVASAEAAGAVYLGHNCSSTDTFNSNAAYRFNLNYLLSSLSSYASGTTDFYNATAGDRSTSDAVYGLFMCRGDVRSQVCQDCVANATNQLLSDSKCPYSEEGVVWNDECLVRFSDHYFFSTLDERPKLVLQNVSDVSNQESLRRVLATALNGTVVEAARSGPQGTKKFAVREADLGESKGVIIVAQCTPDLSQQDCKKCLNDAVQDITECCGGKQGGRVMYPSCFLKVVYIDKDASPAHPTYLNHNCSTNKTFTTNSAYHFNLRSLLSSLSSNATGNTGFYNTTVAGADVDTDVVYGLFMCRGDMNAKLCRECVVNATQRITTLCPLSKEAIIWYEECEVRYSNRSFFSTVDTSPRHSLLNTGNVSDQDSFSRVLASVLNEAVVEAAKPGPQGTTRFGTKQRNISEFQSVYTLAQCTLDLSSQDCDKCLRDVLVDMPWCCIGKQGGRVLSPSCNLRFELYLFYHSEEAPAPVVVGSLIPVPPSPNAGKERSLSRTIVIVVVVIVVSVMLSCFAYWFLWRKRSKNDRAVLKETFGRESTTLESLQFTLPTIEVATNKFSHENKIGRGGFGEVYKGVLSDGKEIAVKRLSRSSGQGATEFNNEILLTAKLQHKNLVALLGFCLEKKEKILIYEYVPNKSLDYFLFGSQRKKVLIWSERYKIIGGIARGILYLHEHSRLKIIHRDLKPSNILLDDEMNPKISDFGLAKIVAINESEGSTNRIVGTYGYMSPEYAMLGQFSEKSDIFSFGIIVLEIVSGKKNAASHESQYVDGLLSYAWKHWRDERLLEILDLNLTELGSYNEVIRYVQIGLLCVQENPDVRPSMATVVSYLSNDLIPLPNPQEPAFFMHGRMELTIRDRESNSNEYANNSKTCSVNEMSMSSFFPR